ncbi:MAG: hypothetical protein JWO79_2938 [Actinomycetia bacterium]|nr:hypothetical protein [Actinomycetes bacterium]
MAVLHRAELKPTKLELLAAWLPGRRWLEGPADAIERVSSFRFDDPAGAVGIETILVRAGDGPVYQVPLTYRDAPLTAADRWLLGTTDHSVLGQRWVYDGCGDPVYAQALALAIVAGTGQAEQFVETGGRLEPRDPDMTVAGSGVRDAAVPTVDAIEDGTDADPTLIRTGPAELAVIRRLDPTAARLGATLTGTWPGQPAPVVLAYASLP